jgi:peptidoglycan/LPS O-acetylase OafA/YrhL
VVAANVYRKGVLRITIAPAVILVGLVLAMGYGYQTTKYTQYFNIPAPVFSTLYGVAFGALVATLLAGLRGRPAPKLASVASAPTYSLYAIHAPILFATSAWNPYLSLVAIAAATAGLFWLVEVPSHHLAKLVGRWVLQLRDPKGAAGIQTRFATTHTLAD